MFLESNLCDDHHSFGILLRWQTGHGENNLVNCGVTHAIVLGKGGRLGLIAKDNVDVLDDVTELLGKELLDEWRRQIKGKDLKDKFKLPTVRASSTA